MTNRSPIHAFLKRAFDLVLAGAGLILLMPLLAAIAVAVRLDSPGPILFRQDRVGLNFRRFRIFKFRSMVADAASRGPLLTAEGDPRITRVGRILRRAKLDELPQLFNVILGDMSLVGPRPEVPRFVEMFAEDFRPILQVKPGVTDPASYFYRDEGRILAASADPERAYVESILPDKLRLAKAYVRQNSIVNDCVVILKTLLEAVGMPAMPLRTRVLRWRRLIVVVVQSVLIVAANGAAFLLRFDGSIPPPEFQAMLSFWPWLLACRNLTFLRFGLHEGLWRYTDIWDLRNIIVGVTASSVPFWIIVLVFQGDTAYPRSVFVIDAVLLILLMGGIRLTRRLYLELDVGHNRRRVIVVGAGDEGALVAREMRRSQGSKVIGFVDETTDDEVGRRIHGVPVLGTLKDLPRLVRAHRPDDVLLALPHADPTAIRVIVRYLEPYRIQIKTLPDLRHILQGSLAAGEIRRLAVEDLLPRVTASVDSRPVKHLIGGRRVMVAGAGGAIGSELCRQIAELKPASLVMLERYENSLNAICLELEDRKDTVGLHPVVGDITDRPRVAAVFREYQPEIVFHAAAHTHVPLMEENPCEAIKNNVRGTRLLAEAAEAAGVDRFIMISTDKAVNPTSVVGASKHVAEMIVRARAGGSGTSFSIVRFGNVLDSVVPRFMDQIKRGGPVTIAHPETKRPFMLVPEAVQLVLHAAAQAESGATYVLEMGEQVKLTDLGRDLIRLAGLVPEDDIKIEFTGLRPGEKLHEEMVATDEDASPSGVDKILCVRSRHKPAADFIARVEALETNALEERRDDVLSELRDLAGAVPGPSIPGLPWTA